MSGNKRNLVEVDQESIDKYARGALNINTKKIKFKALRKTLNEEKERIETAARANAITEVLLPGETGVIESDGQQGNIYRLSQNKMIPMVDLNTAKNAFDFQLTNFGPYSVDYTKNGRLVVILLVTLMKML